MCYKKCKIFHNGSKSYYRLIVESLSLSLSDTSSDDHGSLQDTAKSAKLRCSAELTDN